MLRYEREAISEFWDWWWENRDLTTLTRPHTVAESDPMLVETSDKPYVDTRSDAFFQPDILVRELETGAIEKGMRVDRVRFRTQVVDYLCKKCSVGDPIRPMVVFTGGGYGSGKTTSLQFLVAHNQFPDVPGGFGALQGVDYCKQLIPEFNCLKAVAEGRASEICQTESRLISDQLFARLISERKSFGWDSSMSNRSATFAKLNQCREAGYEVSMIAVQTDPEVAIRRAMQRAKRTRRFAHPNFLLQSHSGFIANLGDYWDAVDNAIHLENTGENGHSAHCPRVLRQKGRIG